MRTIANNRSAMNDLFLAQSSLDSWNEYQYVLTHNKAPRWDWFVITASNEEQARAYRMQIERRQASGLLPSSTRYAVIADPEGKRVGSGGATLHVLRHIAQEIGRTDFTGLRIALLHSGGDSKRIPQYSALGKLFSHVPRELPDGRVSTLFDEFVLSLCGLPGRMSDGLLVLSGDVLLLFNTLQVDLQREGAACISMKALVETGVNHGVFLSDGGRVERFLHKLPEEQLRALGAVNERGYVDIDTGAIWLSGEVASRLYSVVLRDGQTDDALFDRFVNCRERLSFYGDFLFPLAHASRLEDYLKQAAEGQDGPALEACRRDLWQALHGYPLHIIRMAPAEFIHFGTTAELRALMLAAGGRYRHLNWNSHVLCVGAGEDVAMVNSIAHDGVSLQPGCYLEDAELLGTARLGSGCVLSRVTFGGELPPDSLLHVLPQAGGGFVARLCAVGDNPKQGLRDGGTLLGCSLGQFLQANGLTEADLWDDLPGRSLWTARLYPPAATADEAVNASLILLEMTQGRAKPQTLRAWLDLPRTSLRDSFENADVGAILRSDVALEDRIRSSLFITRLAEGCKASEASEALGDSQAMGRRVAVTLSQVEALPLETRYRAYRVLSTLSADKQLMLKDSPEALEDQCYRLINESIQQVTFSQLSDEPPRPLRERVSVSLPVRVNWGGGWSDTPPYCMERGGTVFNAAITLRGERPVQVVVEPGAEPGVLLRSLDLGVSRMAASFAELRPDADPNDPFGLAKAALAVQGLLPRCGEEPPFGQWLRRLGGGFCISTSVDVPKGSGLGTSSILAGALVQALARAFGQKLTLDGVFGRVLCMEQMLSTGGGWQDQVGGIVPGIKLIRSEPGADQRLQIRPAILSPATLRELSERFVLIFTGQRRLARNLLRDIMGNYILNDPQTIQILNDIQQLAVLMCFDLERGDVDGFARLLDRHWELSRKLDPGSTNTCIDQIVSECRPFIDGVMIAGAGGGGFLQMILKRGVTAAQLEECLADVFQDNGVAIWQSAFCME